MAMLLCSLGLLMVLAVAMGTSDVTIQNVIPHLPGYDPYREPPPVVESNWFLAFQAMSDSESWLGCDTRGCGSSACGGRLLDFDEWRNCYEQVYKVFRRDGPGVVRVGDYISLLQFHTDLWLDCEPNENCALSSCGGEVSSIGFDERSKWCECSGSAFRMASFNKTVGTPIYGGEAVMLYSVTEDSYITLGQEVGKTTCPGARFPPPGDKFDECIAAVFRLHY